MSKAPQPSRDWVALTLAIGIATALNLITIGVLLAAWQRGQRSGDYALSENATQVLIAAFGGFIGILGGYVGGRAAERARRADPPTNTSDLAVRGHVDVSPSAAPAAPLSDPESSGGTEIPPKR